MKQYKIEIEIADVEYDALRTEYAAKGLYADWPGHIRSPKENVVKKVVEAVAKIAKGEN